MTDPWQDFSCYDGGCEPCHRTDYVLENPILYLALGWDLGQLAQTVGHGGTGQTPQIHLTAL
jgi:hypothetical protein